MLAKHRREVIGILLILLAVLTLLSLVSYNPAEEPTLAPDIATRNFMGIFGVYVSHYLIKMTIGWGASVFPVILMLLGYWIFAGKKLSTLVRHCLYLLGFGYWIGVLFSIPQFIISSEYYSFSGAGVVGGTTGQFLYEFTGLFGLTSISLVFIILLLSTYFKWSIYDHLCTAFEKLINRFRDWWVIRQEKRAERKKRKKRESTEPDTPDTHDKKLEIVSESNNEPAQRSGAEQTGPAELDAKPVLTASEQEESRETQELDEPGPDAPPETDLHETIEIEDMDEVEEGNLDKTEGHRGFRRYRLPSIELLENPPEIVHTVSDDILKEKADQLEHALKTFNVIGNVVRISPGPVITLFEIEPDEGVRVSKFTNLSDDLARIMKAQRIRVIAPIPGKKTVGIELPNPNPAIVYLRTIVNSHKYIESKSKLTIAIGKTTSGDAFVTDLAKMPHLLIAGATGSGKSVCINTLIMSILYKAKPEEVKFIMVDPKKLELFSYKALVGYHLVTSPALDEYVMTTPDNAVSILNSALVEMERRYTLFANNTVRNIGEYHGKYAGNPEYENIPYIVVVIDELADLMITAGKDVEEPITRLAQMARAVGIHLVVATQRPSVDVITGLIKANFPARIAFQVTQKVDSRTIIDMQGAEKLLGRGDMLFVPPDASEPIRLHNAYVSLEELETVMEHIKKQPKPDEIMLPDVRETGMEDEFILDEDQDELLMDAARLVIQYGQASVSLLQRRFRIGYSRAGRLIDALERLGVVAGHSGSKAREVLVDETYLDTLVQD